jgi:iron-sulfur cluster assembly protein
MVKITDKAQAMILQRGDGKGFLRITVQPGGCSGMTYDANIVADKKPEEKIIDRMESITVITDDYSLPYMHGLEVDYSDDLISAGFLFRNDFNESSCGCGGSFALSGFPTAEMEGCHG